MQQNQLRSFIFVLCIALAMIASACSSTPPTPNAAAPTSAPAAANIKHVLLISIDGFHAMDLANFIKANPNSTLAELSKQGTTYSKASSTIPSDSFPGLLALITGGGSKTTGVYYDDSYDRNLLPPVNAKAGDKPGTEVVYDESIDKNADQLDGGGGIDPNALPRDPQTKQPVYPHSFLRVNTIFEVIKNAGMYIRHYTD
jgi:hypothetical protein